MLRWRINIHVHIYLCTYRYIRRVTKKSSLTTGWNSFVAAIPPKLGSHYRSAEMQFWNEDLPNMLRHPNKDIPMFSRPKGPRPTILDFADVIGKYANGSSDKNYDIHNAWSAINYNIFIFLLISISSNLYTI